MNVSAASFRTEAEYVLYTAWYAAYYTTGYTKGLHKTTSLYSLW